ncbi:MAG TPA: glycosyltransferase, partial [Longimicrobiaceae bacterium]|nr:glycosyltransferase [Longimicrobiaceae bacterium]
MRIAVANWSRREAGGAERYLARVIPALRDAGHEVALFCEMDAPLDRGPIPLPEGAPTWSVEELGLAGALDALRGWRPDVVFNQGVFTPEVEEALQGVADCVFFAHGYLGTCISGAKSFKRPVVTPCDRRFGWECLLHYYPKRCGGMSPLTMLRDFRAQRGRRDRLGGYRAIVTNSAHTQSEFARYVDDPSRVHAVPLPVYTAPAPVEAAPRGAADDGPWRLLFLGRMTSLKGGDVLLDALPAAAAALDRPLHVTIAGDGPDIAAW